MKKFRLLFSLLSGLAAALAAWLYIGGIESKYEKGFEKIPVVVTKRYIEQNETIESGDVELRAVPALYAQPGHIKNLSDILNPDTAAPGYMTCAPIQKGEQVLSTKLIKIGSETGVSALVPGGKRAFTIPYQGMAVKGIVSAGDRVDLLAVSDERSRTILQNAPVLVVGRRSVNKDKGAAQDEIEETVPVTLAAAPDEIQNIALFCEKGRIFISLRPLGERTTMSIQSVSIAHSGRNNAAGDFADSAKKKYDELLGVWKKSGVAAK